MNAVEYQLFLSSFLSILTFHSQASRVYQEYKGSTQLFQARVWRPVFGDHLF